MCPVALALAQGTALPRCKNGKGDHAMAPPYLANFDSHTYLHLDFLFLLLYKDKFVLVFLYSGMTLICMQLHLGSQAYNGQAHLMSEITMLWC